MGQNVWGYRCALVIAAALAVVTPLRAEDAASSDAPAVKPVYRLCDCDPAASRIEAILDQPLKVPLEFVETPLNQIAMVLADDYGIPILFDTAALDAVATSPDVEVTINIAKVSLRSALDLMLRNAGDGDLTYFIDNEVLLITTQEESERRLMVCVYRVDDLVVLPRQSIVGARIDYEPLVQLIWSSVERESWLENGTGEGEIVAFPPGIIVISQTKNVHDKVDQFLARLRSVRRDVLGEQLDDQKAADNNPITRSIPINGNVVGQDDSSKQMLRDAILKSVDWEGEADAAEEKFLYVMPNRVLVRHLPRVVAQVEQTVQELTYLPRVNVGGANSDSSGVGGSGASDLAEAPRGGEDGGQRRARGGGGRGGFGGGAAGAPAGR
jgi:hypothetical protein